MVLEAFDPCPAFRFLCIVIFCVTLSKFRRGVAFSDKHCSLTSRKPFMQCSLHFINKPMPNIFAVRSVITKLLSLGGNRSLYTKMQQALVTPASPQQPRCLHPH